MADKVEKPKTVTMEALQWHTYNGKAYSIGDTYELEESLVDSVTFQGRAARADRDEVAKQQAKDAERARKEASKPVEPMTTDSFKGKK
jgi:hypothetical protein